MIPSSSISTGWGAHSCATTTIGLRCWGENFSGETGSNAFGDDWTPSTVPGLDAASVVAAQLYTCALTRSRGAKCWGNSAAGRLGNATAMSSVTPTDVVGLTSGAVSLAATNNACAITSSHGVKCLGRCLRQRRRQQGRQVETGRRRRLGQRSRLGLDRGRRWLRRDDFRSCEVLGRQHHGRARKRRLRQRGLPLPLPHTRRRRRPGERSLGDRSRLLPHLRLDDRRASRVLGAQ